MRVEKNTDEHVIKTQLWVDFKECVLTCLDLCERVCSLVLTYVRVCVLVLTYVRVYVHLS